MRDRDSWAWYEFPRSEPRPVQGGVKARSQRGAFGSTWWGRRWIEVLEGFGWSNRLQRGRRYARLGQVMDFRLGKGRVEATVQGSRSKPYQVQILLSSLPGAAWEKALRALSSRAAFTAQLLAGEMPQNIEEAFREAGVGLFPEKDDEFRAECDCPDWANPCTHIAALHYILGEAFDRDPFLLFALRGRTREEFLQELRAIRSRGPATGSRKGAPGTRHPVPPLAPASAPSRTLEDLPTDPSAFWGDALPRRERGSPEPPRAPGAPHALLRALGTPSVLRGRDDLIRQLEGAYDVVGSRAHETLEGPRVPPRKAIPAEGVPGPRRSASVSP